MRLVELRGITHSGGELAEYSQQLTVSSRVEQGGVHAVLNLHASLRSVTCHSGGTCVSVLHVVDRVLVALGSQQAQVNIDGGVHRVAGQLVASRVNANSLDQVLEGDHGAGTLGHADGLAVLDQVHQLTNHDLNLVGAVAKNLGDSLQTAHVAVVVSTEHVNRHVCGVLGAGHLVLVVGDIARHVGVVTVRLDDHAILVVAVVGGAHPPCAVSLEELTVLAHSVEQGVHLAAFEHGVLVEEHVEVGAECRQGLLDLIEHQVSTDFAENLFGVLSLKRVGALSQNLVLNVNNVRASVAVLGGLLAASSGNQGAHETVNLSAVVVEVVFTHDVSAFSLKDAGERITDGSPAGATQVDGAGGVRGDELKVDGLAGELVAAAVCFTSLNDGGGKLTGSCGVQGDVQEAGASNIYGCNTGDGADLLCQKSCCLTRVLAHLLGELQSDVGCPVAVFAGLGALHSDGGQFSALHEGQLAGGNGFFKGKRNGFGEFFRSHNKLF